MKKINRKYSLTFFMGMAKIEILETVDCDYWVEICEDGSSIIYCGNNDEDSSIGYPSNNLRKIVQNHGVLKVNNLKENVMGYI